VLRGKYTRYEKLYLYAIDGIDQEFHHLDDEDFIGYWEEEDLSVLFFHRAKDDLVARLLAKKGLKLELATCVPYEKWGEGRQITPFKIGPFKWAPQWYEGEADFYFDPGVVFGSGTHPSSRLCLKALYQLWQQEGPFGQVADLGCGSGLISLLAAKLGAQVLAIDINPLCVELTQKNLRLNHLESKAQVQRANVLSLVPYRAEVVVANLFKGLLLDLFGLPSFWQNRFYIFSGFVPSMEKELKEALKPYAQVIHREEEGGWVLYVAGRRR